FSSRWRAVAAEKIDRRRGPRTDDTLVVTDKKSTRSGYGSLRKRGGAGDLLVFVRLHARHADGTHALVLVHEGHAAWQRQDPRELDERRALLEAILPELRWPARAGRGDRLLRGNLGRHRPCSVEPLEIEQVAALVHDGDGHAPLVLGRLALAGGGHLLNVGRGEGRTVAHGELLDLG